jgi:hypothetical protein
MGKNLFDLRFVIEGADGFRSLQWRLWITSTGDVYLTTRQMGGIQKYSFHQSGICRSAFTQEHGAPSTMPDRAMFKWKRTKTPLAGAGGASRVAWIAFPTDFLSRLPAPTAKITLISAAPPRDATYLELGYTFESEGVVMSAFQENQRRLHSYTKLPSGEAFYVSSYHSDWENKDLHSPPGEGSVFPKLLFSSNDPLNTGRPVRMLFGPIPKDGDALVLQELGGYPFASDG